MTYFFPNFKHKLLSTAEHVHASYDDKSNTINTDAVYHSMLCFLFFAVRFLLSFGIHKISIARFDLNNSTGNRCGVMFFYDIFLFAGIPGTLTVHHGRIRVFLLFIWI